MKEQLSIVHVFWRSLKTCIFVFFIQHSDAVWCTLSSFHQFVHTAIYIDGILICFRVAIQRDCLSAGKSQHFCLLFQPYWFSFCISSMLFGPSVWVQIWFWLSWTLNLLKISKIYLFCQMTDIKFNIIGLDILNCLTLIVPEQISVHRT